MNKRIIVKRLVICKRGTSVYHYWKETNQIDKDNLFYIEEIDIHKGIEVLKSHYIIYKKQTIENFEDCCDIIDRLIIEKKRDKKIEMILNA